MPHESQTERYSSLIESITELGYASEDAEGFSLFDLSISETQSVPHRKSTIHLETLKSTFENINEHLPFESQKQVPVKFDPSPMLQNFDLLAARSAFVAKAGGSSQSLVTVVEALVEIVGKSVDQLAASLTIDDYQRLAAAREKLIDTVGEDENHFLTPLINFIGNLIKIRDEESNSSANLLSQETDDSEHTDATTLKPHRPEKVGRPATLPRLKLADLLSQETDDSEHTDATTLKPHRPEKVGRPATLPRLKLADLLSQETDDSEPTGPATLKPHRPEKVGRPATLPRLKLADLLSQETDDSEPDEVDMGPAVGNEVW